MIGWVGAIRRVVRYGNMRLSAYLLAGLAALTPAKAEPVDPTLIRHADFVRHADADWTGLSVRRQSVADQGVTWKLWRIANRQRQDGPLWVVPHDNENAAFAAGLAAVRRWGGTLIAVDSGNDDSSRAARYVHAHDGSRLDPNRTFTEDYLGYVAAVLADLGRAPRAIVALHTNAAGFDPSLATCGGSGETDRAGGGSGGISILLCNDTYTPRPAATRSWPWDDDDSVVIAPYLAAGAPGDGWCQRKLIAGNFNVTFEKVGASDGSLSNYAALRGLPYLNFETRELGADEAGIAAAGQRLTAMVDAAMIRCLGSDTRLLAAAGGGKEVR